MSTNREGYGWNSTLRRRSKKKIEQESAQQSRPKPTASLTRTKGLKRTPLKKTSKAMAAKLKQYSTQRARYLTENPICAINGTPATDVHHTKKRGKYLLDETTWLAVSREAHQQIHDNPRWAREKGYLI